MSSDGASMGVGADRALETILGGEDQPSESERQTPEQMLDMIRSQGFENLDYGTTATAIARLILEAYEKFPEIQDVPKDHVYLRDGSGSMVWPVVYLTADLHGALKQLHAEEPEKLAVLSDITGFMWGWAVNAVQYVMGLPEKPNPAIVTIGADGG